MSQKKIIIAIDGHSSCGKSTLARELAAQLGYRHIDSGAMYRAVTLHFLRNGVSPANEEAVVAALQDIELAFEESGEGGDYHMHLNGENVHAALRDMIVAEKVSEVAAVKAVRRFAVKQQQQIGRRKGIVMDGRDIGTVVFPDAELKIFLTADPAVRVVRRYQELIPTNPAITLDEVRHNLEMRDYIDSNREESPLRRADGAVILDNSDLTREEQLQQVMKWISERTKAMQLASS